MKVLLRDSVLADLEGISSWIANDNPSAARGVVLRILDAIERLGEFPGLGHAGKVAGTREWVVRGLPYIIVCEVDMGLAELTVLAVFHGARDR
jgi:plasmid stabilization system protein ParE